MRLGGMDRWMDTCSYLSYQCPRHIKATRGYMVAERGLWEPEAIHLTDSALCQLVSHPPGLSCLFLKPPDPKATLDIGPGPGPTHLIPRTKKQGDRTVEDASLGGGHHVATEEKAEALVTMRAWRQQAHTAAFGCLALDEFHGVCPSSQIQLAAVQCEGELRD